jgi:hypothetical protein
LIGAISIGTHGEKQWDTLTVTENDFRFIRFPSDYTKAMRLRTEKRREKHIRYNQSEKGKKRESNRPKRERVKGLPIHEREFIVWDGEGPQDTNYSLLGNSEGLEICHPKLSTKACFELLILSAQQFPHAINVAFGFTYDVSCMCKDLSWRHLRQLKDLNHTTWQGYRIEHIPRKWFKLTYGNISIKIFDLHSFFASSLVSALEKWKIGPFAQNHAEDAFSFVISPENVSVPTISVLSKMQESEIVRVFKNLRSEFEYKDIESIKLYMRLELKYTKVLAETLRKTFLDAGYSPKSWHGPGALARMAFKRHDVYAAMAECPIDIRIASRYAFIAGRFEGKLAGHAKGKVYSADINSAYPYFCSRLPNLAKGRWRYGKNFEKDKFAIYHIRYESKPNGLGLYPLPYRDKHGGISWPHRVEGWYWAPEAELVKDDSNAEFVEAWYFDEIDPNDRPFAFVNEYYHRRQLLKKIGNPAEYTFKIIINAIYGQLAQRVGWDRKNKKPPKTHQLEWAGFITSGCRAMVYRVAKDCGKYLISIDTDGIYSLRPIRNVVNSDVMGEWKLETYDDGLFWQSGIYGLKEKGEWKKAKTRGIPKGTYTVEDLFASLNSMEPLKLTKKVFISYGLALQMKTAKLNEWVMEPHEFKFGGNGKRYHPNPKSKSGKYYCQRICGKKMHKLTYNVLGYGTSYEPIPFSHPHQLPWIKPLSIEKNLMDTWTLFDRNDLDFDDDWIMENVNL